MMELADMQDLGSCAVMRWGSNPHARTKTKRQYRRFVFAQKKGDIVVLSKRKNKKSCFTICIIVVSFLLICAPLLLKIPAIKVILSWWLDCTDNPNYKTTYIEAVSSMIGVFLSVFGALRTEDYLRKRDEKMAKEECARHIHGELNRCFYKLQSIFRETKNIYKIEDTGPEFRDRFCEVAKMHRLNLGSDWIVVLAQLNGQIDLHTWKTLQNYFSRLSVIDQALQTEDVERIKEVYAPYICWFITTDGRGIHSDVELLLKNLEGIFSEKK